MRVEKEEVWKDEMEEKSTDEKMEVEKEMWKEEMEEKNTHEKMEVEVWKEGVVEKSVLQSIKVAQLLPTPNASIV